MVRTLVGYAGGSTPSPTYRNMGDHTECVLVEYDPEVIGYERLVAEFLCGHEPFLEPWSLQYRSLVLWQGQRQHHIARQLLEQAGRMAGERLYTALSPAGRFYPAEESHQKYFLRMTPAVLNPLRAIYPRPQDLAESTVSARTNAILGGYGTPGDLTRWLPLMALPDAAEKALLRCVGSNSRKREQRLFP